MEYTVRWVTQVEADSPEEAATMAAAMQRDPETLAIVFFPLELPHVSDERLNTSAVNTPLLTLNLVVQLMRSPTVLRTALVLGTSFVASNSPPFHNCNRRFPPSEPGSLTRNRACCDSMSAPVEVRQLICGEFRTELGVSISSCQSSSIDVTFSARICEGLRIANETTARQPVRQ